MKLVTSNHHKMTKNDFFFKKNFSHVYCAYFRPQTNFEPSVTSGSAGIRKNMLFWLIGTWITVSWRDSDLNLTLRTWLTFWKTYSTSTDIARNWEVMGDRSSGATSQTIPRGQGLTGFPAVLTAHSRMGKWRDW